MITDVPCVLFAGGKSSRMGSDKALLPFGTFATLAEFQYTRLQAIFQDVYILCKERFAFSANYIEEKDFPKVYAPTVGFCSAFNTLPDQELFVLSVDTPFIEEKQIKAILKYKNKKHDAVIAQTPKRIHPLCGLYSRNLHKKFCEALQKQEYKLSSLLENADILYTRFDDETVFFNMNTKKEYEVAYKKAAFLYN
jgi:molybdenum cofactor guanylyltransferase